MSSGQPKRASSKKNSNPNANMKRNNSVNHNNMMFTSMGIQGSVKATQNFKVIDS
jgi:hypothetical protein